MIKNKRVLLLIFIFSLFITAIIPAQEADLPETESTETNKSGRLTPEQQRIEMEIKISTLPELAALCRQLGLSESGTREELSSRLREHYGISSAPKTPENQKLITIDSAQTTEYFKIDTTDEEYARLKGDVKLTMKDGSNIHTISAEEILFNRTRNIMTARGKVEYIKTTESDGAIESFRGENITVNINDWSCTFLDGSSERKMSGEEEGYKFSGQVLSRTGDDATILSRATITNANEEESYWSISASKIWLLPGSDFALFNAWLKVGEIPMLYIPVFYYPVDEMIFHPVFGVRSHEGAFFQTTTYILGRPKPDENSQNSITKILGGSGDMEVERQGIFLKSTNRKYVAVTEPSLRLLVDHYVNLGTFAGLEFSLPRKGILSSPIDLFLGLGYTRTITRANPNPYETNKDGTFDWNHSNFFSQNIPFRYKINFESGISYKYGSVTWKFPYYSDPYVNRDFTENRAESMDWFALLEEGLETQSVDSRLSNPQWTINSNLNPNVSFLNPVVSRISISNLSTTLSFTGIEDGNVHRESPVRQFFAPNIYTIYNLSAGIYGNPLSIGNRGQSSSSAQAKETKNPLEGIGTPISPWENEKETITKNESDDILVLPAINQRFELPRTGNITYDIDYSITPASSTELQFMSQSANWPSAEDVKWDDVQSIQTSVSGDAKITFRANHSSGLFTNTVSFNGRGSWRDYSFINEEAIPYLDSSGNPDPDKVLAEKKKLYAHTKYTSTYNYDGTVRPLLSNPIFGQSSISYSFAGTMVNSKRFDDKINDSPELTPVWGKWVKQNTVQDNEIYGLTGHNISTTLSANILNNPQSVRLTYDLPPLDSQIGVSAAFKVWISETSVSFRIRQLPEDSNPVKVSSSPEIWKNGGEWIHEPVTITETLRLPASNLFTFTMVIKPEENNDITNINSNLTLFNSSFRTGFKARKTFKSRFETTTWEDYGDEVLQPEELSFSYNKNFQERFYFKNILGHSLNLNTSLTYDLIKHTNSRFALSIENNFKINKLMDIKLTATANNAVIFRYFKGIPAMDDLTFMYKNETEIQKRQNNVFLDLIDSFNFFDESARKRTGFKMGTVELDIKHYLGDWQANLNLRMYPYEDKEASPKDRYKVTNDISFSVQWKPIAEIKTETEYKGELDRWTIK